MLQEQTVFDENVVRFLSVWWNTGTGCRPVLACHSQCLSWRSIWAINGGESFLESLHNFLINQWKLNTPIVFKFSMSVHVLNTHIWPIRSLRPTCANQNAWVFVTPWRSKCDFWNSITQPSSKGLKFTINFVVSLISFWLQRHFDVGLSWNGWGSCSFCCRLH